MLGLVRVEQIQQTAEKPKQTEASPNQPTQSTLVSARQRVRRWADDIQRAGKCGEETGNPSR